jgi:two-component system alkaline phosphatase synthesis response regulator PhoP
MRTFSMPYNVLLVEDEPGLVLTLTDLLRSEGYRVETAEDGLEGLERAGSGDFDVIILDVMLPGKNGFDVCRDLRRRGLQTPVLMLTARGQLTDKVVGLKLGADDYLTKPFEPLELLARLEALLRRVAAPATLAETFAFGPVTADFRSTEVRRDGRLIEMSSREFQLLRYFIQHRGATISRRQLLRDVWGYDEAAFTRTVDMHVALLRQKLEDDPKTPRHFLTVRGFGYKFQVE